MAKGEGARVEMNGFTLGGRDSGSMGEPKRQWRWACFFLTVTLDYLVSDNLVLLTEADQLTWSKLLEETKRRGP